MRYWSAEGVGSGRVVTVRSWGPARYAFTSMAFIFLVRFEETFGL